MWFQALWVRVPLPTPEKKKSSQKGRLFSFLWMGGTRRGRWHRRWRKKVSGGHFFSPGESPLICECIRKDVGAEQTFFATTASFQIRLFFTCLLPACPSGKEYNLYLHYRIQLIAQGFPLEVFFRHSQISTKAPALSLSAFAKKFAYVPCFFATLSNDFP